jgi:hypothetical protein
MTALAKEFALADPDERFDLLIDIFVDGLSRRAAQPYAPAQPAPGQPACC